MTRTPVAIIGPPGMLALISPTSPGAIPVAGRNIFWPFGQNSPKRLFHVAMTPCGVTFEPICTENVFWNRRPNPPFAAIRRRPRTFALIAPTRSLASSRRTGFAQLASSRDIAVLPLCPDGRERRGLGVMDPDRFIEAGKLKNLFVVIVQSTCEELLLLPVRAHEKRHEQPDPATVHVVEAREIEQDRPRLLARLAVRGHERTLRRSGHVAAHADHDGALVDAVRRGGRRRRGHLNPPAFNAALSSAKIVMKSARRVISKISR